MKKLISVLLALILMAIMVLPCFAAQNVSPVTLKIDGFEDREVISFNYEFGRSADIEGQPAGIPKANSFVIRVKGMNDDNNKLFAWSLSDDQPKDLTLDFINTVDGNDMKRISLKNTYCIRYTEYWNQDGTYYEEIEVVAQEFRNGQAFHMRNWK